VFVCRKLLIN